mgnify:FL=1
MAEKIEENLLEENLTTQQIKLAEVIANMERDNVDQSVIQQNIPAIKKEIEQTTSNTDYVYGGIVPKKIKPFFTNEKFNNEANEEKVVEEVVEEEKTIKEKIGSFNVYKGTTLADLLGDPVEQEVSDDFKTLPVADPDNTRVILGPEIEVVEVFDDSQYWDEDTNTVKSDVDEFFDDGEFTEEEEETEEFEEEEEEEEKEEVGVEKEFMGNNFFFKMLRIGIDATKKSEIQETFDAVSVIWKNIPLSFKQSYYTTKLLTNKQISEITKGSSDYDNIENLIKMDIEGGNLGFSTENPFGIDNSTFDADGGVQWVSPQGETVDLNVMRRLDKESVGRNIEDLQNLSNQRIENGWKVVYKRSGKEVGYKYRAWQLSQFEKIIELEAKKIKPKVSFVQGYKKEDASMFIGSVFLAISSLLETMLPAIATRGVSLYPQIVTPKYVEYNREKARSLYPDLSEMDAIEKLIKSQQEEFITPLVLGFAELALEKIGITGISNSIKLMKPGGLRLLTTITTSGSREGITEWAQLGTTIINREVARLKGEQEKRVKSGLERTMSDSQIFEKASAIALTAMCSEEGLENFLLGFVGGTFASSTGAMINRALRMDPASINFVNSKISEVARLRSIISESISPKVKALLQKKIDKIMEELTEHVNVSKKLQVYLTKDEKATLLSFLNEYSRLSAKAIDEKMDYFLNFEINGKTIAELAKEENLSLMGYLEKYEPQMAKDLKLILQNIEEEKLAIQEQINDVKDRANQRMIEDGLKGVENIVKSEGGKIVVFNTEQELNDHIEKNRGKKGYTSEEINKMRKADGFQIGNIMFINKHIAVNVGAISVAQHEAAHFLFGKHFRDSEGNITAEGLVIINNFKNSLGVKAYNTILQRLKGAGYNLSDLNTQEEFLTMYIDGVIKGDFKASSKSMRILGKALMGIMKSKGYENIKFDNWQDIQLWLENYIKQRNNSSDPIKRKTPTEDKSNTNFSLTDLKPKTNSFGKTDQTTFNNSGVNKVVEYLYGKLDGLIMKYVSSEVKRLDDFKQEDYLQDTYIQLIKHIKTFKVAEYNEDGTRKLDANGEPIGNDDLFGFIVAYARLKGLDVTKKLDFNFVQRLDDENSFIDDVAADDVLDLDLAIEEDVTFSKLRKILGIEKGSLLYKKIIEAVKTIIPGEISNVNSPEFKALLAKYFQDKFFDDIKRIIGGSPGKQTYKDFIINNAKALYDVFSQQVFNKSFQDFIILTETNISSTRVDEAIREGLLPKGTSRTSGPDLFEKLPWNEDTQKKWVDNFLNPTKGRPASKQNSLIEALSLIIGFDAVMETISSEEFKETNDIALSTIATIGLKIDRGLNVRFSNTTLNINNFDAQEAGDMVRYVRGFIPYEVSPEDLSVELNAEFPNASKETIDFVVLMYDKAFIANSESTGFKVQVNNDPDISDATKKKIKDVKNLRYDEQALEDLYLQAYTIATALGPKVMKVIGYEWLGFTNRVMDSAELKESGLSGKYYEKLEDLKAAVENSENITLPKGLDLSKVRLMNKKYKLFKAIEKILFDGDSKIDGSNIKWKKAELAKLSVQIKEAGKANIVLAKLLAKTLITTSNDDASIIQLLQIQTSIVSGFRALTTLDLITVLEGSQKPSESHPYFQMELDIAKKAVHGPKYKVKELRGKPKYPTEELAIAAAIAALGTKGEHAAANANTMAKIANLRAKYLKDKSIDLDGELDKIFANHGQIHTTKGVTNIIDDEGGATNAMDWLRAMLTELRGDMFSSDGKTAEDVIIEKQDNNVRFSLSVDFNKILEQNEGVKAEATYSPAQAEIKGRSIVRFWDYVYPPSAYDLELFLYRIIGKGELGEKQMKFFKAAILDPYDRAYQEINKEAQRVKSEYKALLKKLPLVKKSLNKIVKGSKFTIDQAIRVAIWTDMGVNMQELGLSKRDQKILVDAVNSDQELLDFKNSLKDLNLNNGEYVLPTEYWTVENIAYDLDSGVNKTSRAKFLAEWKENIEQIFSEENKNKLKTIYGNNFVESLNDMLYRMEFGRGKSTSSRIETAWLNWVNNSVGAIMFFNMRSAVLQTISAFNYVNWTDNNPAKAALAFANFPQFLKDFGMIFNSDYLKERRSGNRQDVNMNELTVYLKGKQNKAKAIIAFLLEKGFAPTQIADSFAISSGGATFYRNRVKTYVKEGFSQEAAEQKAFNDFENKTEKGQQSSRPDLISEQQAGGLGKLLLAFKNTPMQYNRLMIKAILDIKNKRGSTRENLSKIAYYGFIQNVIFGALQTALFAALGDEDEWDTKTERVANGMIDTILNGLGLTGAVAVTLKNAYLTYRKQNEKGWNADHTYTILQFANLSPTIGSKLRKLYGSITTEKYNRKAIEEMGFSIENPLFNSFASLCSALTNIPTDRMVQKIQNIILASDSETEAMNKIGLLMGWNPWDLNIETKAKKVKQQLKDEEKKKKKQCTAIKSKGGRCNNKTTNKSGLCYAHDK